MIALSADMPRVLYPRLFYESTVYSQTTGRVLSQILDLRGQPNLNESGWTYPWGCRPAGKRFGLPPKGLKSDPLPGVDGIG